MLDFVPVVYLTFNITEEGSFVLKITKDTEYVIDIWVENIEDFSDIVYTLTYDAARLQLLDFAAQTSKPDIEAGAVDGTPLTIISHTGGILQFTANQTVPNGFVWSGALTLLRFKALESCITVLEIEQGGKE
jgi:hypothetical protein